MMAALEAARTALLLIDTIVDAAAEVPARGSVEIGLEANVGPGDYPLIRLVPSRITPGRPYASRTAEVLIYFGMPNTNSEGMPAVYAALFAMEAEIIEVIKTLQGRYLETVTDEDRLDTYKLMAIRCELLGV